MIGKLELNPSKEFVSFSESFRKIGTEWLHASVEFLPRLLLAILVLLLFYTVYRLTRKVNQNAYQKLTPNKPALGLCFSRLTSFGILGIGVFSALAVLGLDDSVASLLAGLGLVGLALGFALQDIMANFASGVILTFKSPFQLGDFVETSGHMGTITEVQLRSTRIVTLEGRTVNIPNKLIFQNPFINYTAQGKVRIELLFPIHVKSDSQRAIDLLIPVIEKVSDRLPNEKVVGGINRITDFFIEIQIFLWVPTGLKPLLLFRSEAYLGGLKELRKNGIDIAQTSFVSAN